jgi:hypothetical protein
LFAQIDSPQRQIQGGPSTPSLPSTSNEGRPEMKTIATLAAAVCAATIAFSVPAAESVAKMQKDQAESNYKMAKKQANADEKSAMAQCKTMSGDAEKQCKKDATATHDKTMADAKDSYDKAKADYKASK